MALWYPLRVNSERIGTVDIRRVEPLDLSDQEAIRDVVSTYEVSWNGEVVGTVRHRYGDRALKLNALAAVLLADADADTRFEELLERSSLGTPEAVTARRSVPPETVEKIMRRVAELRAEESS